MVHGAGKLEYRHHGPFVLERAPSAAFIGRLTSGNRHTPSLDLRHAEQASPRVRPMTRSLTEYQAAQGLIREGVNDCEISRRLSVPRSTVREWRRPHYVPLGYTTPQPRGVAGGQNVFDCPRCHEAALDEPNYAYLFGLYAGDGHITQMPNGRSFRLRITLDQRYVEIIDECYGAVSRLRPNERMKVNFAHPPGCVVVQAYWMHWRCLFPQHGRGRKHMRSLALHSWQKRIVDRYPRPLLRGLVQSDGWRGTNFALVRGKRYEYPRYQFTNESRDLHDLFRAACDQLGVRWTEAPRQTYVSRRSDVAFLDSFIGSKR